MLAELAAANAAFGIIKSTLSNSGDILKAGKAISDFVSAKDALQNKAQKKKNSFWHKVSAKNGDDLEEFMALETIKQNEEQLKQAMIYCGRAGLWTDYVKFCAKARTDRAEAAKEQQKARERLKDNILMTLAWLMGFGVVGGGLFLIIIIIKKSQGG